MALVQDPKCPERNLFTGGDVNVIYGKYRIKNITFYLYSTQKPLSFRFIERNWAAFVCECVSMIIHIIIDEGLIRVPACQR